MNSLQLLGAIELGLVYSIVALGIYLSFRIINFPDLTVDGSFPLGAAVSASLMIQGISPIMATCIASLSGGLAGFITAYLHIRFKILNLLAGILIMTALSSINLRIMGRPNIALLTETTLFSAAYPSLLILSIIVIGLIILLSIFLNTQFGLALRAVGINNRVCSAYGIHVGTMILIGLSLSNGLVAFAGSIFSQVYGLADISMGTGTLIVGLASIIVGENLCKSHKTHIILISCVLGSIFYRLVIALALNAHCLGLKSSDLNLITSIMVMAALLIPQLRQKIISHGATK